MNVFESLIDAFALVVKLTPLAAGLAAVLALALT